MAEESTLPSGVMVGHFTDRSGWTGCTAIVMPDGGVASCEVRGGGPGTRETDLLSPASTPNRIHALLFTGGSAFGLGAADGVVAYLAERGIGHPTRNALVPLVPAAVVYDLALGDSSARPDSRSGYEACVKAQPSIERGSVGAGTGCTVGKLLGPDAWTKGGVGFARLDLQDVCVAALVVANPFGDVIAADGTVAAGVRVADGFGPTTSLIYDGQASLAGALESTTLVCVLTDAQLSKTEAWLVARAATAGIARSVVPSATAVDGDVVYCVATGEKQISLFACAVAAADVTAQAVRDAVASATAAPGCPTASEAKRGHK